MTNQERISFYEELVTIYAKLMKETEDKEEIAFMKERFFFYADQLDLLVPGTLKKNLALVQAV